MLSIIKEKFLSIKTHILQLSSKERWFFFFAMICGFLICSEYAVIRPVSTSLFISAYTAEWFPIVWLCTLPLNFLFVSLYNRWLQKLGCVKMFFGSIICIMTINLFCALFMQKFSFLPFAFYLWKETYILFMFQQLWAVIHMTMKMDQAKFLYGIFFGIGALGAVTGSLFPSFCAVPVGSTSLIFATIPIYVCLFLAYTRLVKYSAAQNVQEQLSATKTSESFIHGIKLIGASRFLMFILLIVILMQSCSSIIDYQFNTHLQKAFTDVDLRTQYAARVMSMVHFTTFILQFIGTFLLIKLLGVRKMHFLVPTLIGVSALGLKVFPIFAMISFSYITVKSCDFSIFGVIKEMLYVPLQPEQKIRAKAVIDIFAYRSAKAMTSSLILILQFFAFTELLSVLSWVLLGIFITWISMVAFFLRKKQMQALQGAFE